MYVNLVINADNFINRNRNKNHIRNDLFKYRSVSKIKKCWTHFKCDMFVSGFNENSWMNDQKKFVLGPNRLFLKTRNWLDFELSSSDFSWLQT